MSTSHRFVAVIVFAAAALSQQDAASTRKPPDARAFVPPAPVSEAWVDFKALRESGVWDALSRSLASTLMPMAEQQLGFSLSRLDRLRAYGQRPKGPDALEGETIVIFESGDELDVPLSPNNGNPRIERIAGHDVTIAPSWGDPSDPSVWVVPKKGVLVYGHLPPARLELRPWFRDRNMRRMVERPTGARS